MDTTYFSRYYWIMVFRAYELKKNLLFKEVRWENLYDYKEWIRILKERWWRIKAIACDWKKWLLQGFPWIPTQMCHFHQKQIIIRYITRNPKLEASIELRDISSMLWKVRKTTFKTRLIDWHERYKKFLSEKNDNKKFIHERTRKAYRSLSRNLEWLYTYEDNGHLLIPTTSNALEWTFKHLKDKIRIHWWLRKDRKLKLIFELLQK